MTLADKIARAKTDYDNVYNKGVENGVKSEYDRFWDSYQQNGKRRTYRTAFAGDGWTDEIFYPKYNLVSAEGIRMFQECKITDLEARLNECNVILDISEALNNADMFAGSTITVCPEITIQSNARFMDGSFNNCKNLHTIRKISIQGETSASWGATFTGCLALENIVFEGAIGNNIKFADSKKLTKESITSIVNALSTTTSGLTATFSLTAVQNVFDASSWQALYNSKPNWTISLV